MRRSGKALIIPLSRTSLLREVYVGQVGRLLLASYYHASVELSFHSTCCCKSASYLIAALFTSLVYRHHSLVTQPPRAVSISYHFDPLF